MIGRGVVSMMIVLLLWQVGVWMEHIPAYFLPGPWAIVQTIWITKALLWHAMWGTLAEALLGWFIALLCAAF